MSLRANRRAPMAYPENDILIYGDQCANDLQMGEFLARRGLRVRVARKARDASVVTIDLPRDFFTTLAAEQVVHIRGPGELVALARASRMVLTFTGAFGFALRWRWPLRRWLGLPPVFNYPTGSDFSELLAQSSPIAWFYRYFVRTCDINAAFAYPHILKNILRYRVDNIAFLHHPYLLPKPRPEVVRPGRLRFFHASHLDFRLTDNGRHRNSSKGNDRFLRAFLRALDGGLDAECLMLDRGPDRAIARQLIEASPHAQRFIWLPHLGREEFFDTMASADMVVDQFDVGGLGGIAVEAMALGKPVLLYLDRACLPIVYSEPPPVLNAYTEDEIYACIMAHSDSATLASLGRSAREWVHRNHSWETCLDTFLFYYALLTGHEVVDYGYGRDAYRS